MPSVGLEQSLFYSLNRVNPFQPLLGTPASTSSASAVTTLIIVLLLQGPQWHAHAEAGSQSYHVSIYPEDVSDPQPAQ